jgi:hypothetical protein
MSGAAQCVAEKAEVWDEPLIKPRFIADLHHEPAGRHIL